MEQFQEVVAKGLELRVVRERDNVKLKVRTPDYLYTFKTTSDQANRIIKGVKDLEVIEITPVKEEKSKPEEKKD